MATYKELRTEDGAIAFEGTVRHVQEYGACVFRIELPSRIALYGEWRPAYAVNGNDFDIVIVSFGYLDKETVSNGSYLMFSEAERASAQRLIEALFRAEHLREKMFPFTVAKAKFLGGVSYAPGWVVIESEYRAAIRSN